MSTAMPLGKGFSTVIHMAALGVAAVLLGACSSGRGEQKPAAVSRVFRVGLLTPGPVSDQSWNAGAYQGLLRIRDSLGAQTSHIQTKTPAEFEENFQQYGAQGYDVVFGHGFEFQDAARAVAPQFPRTVYVITSGNISGPNIAGMVFGFAGPSYLAGMIAGAVTRSNVIGVIGGTELPPVRESFQAFSQGAHAVNPRVKVVTSYIGNWDDVSAGTEQARAQLSRGVDVIFQNADAAGLGVFQAVREAKHAYIFGSNSNQNAVAPEVTLGSVAIDLPHAFLLVAKEVQQHTFTPGVLQLGMREDVVKLVLNPTTEQAIPAATRHAVDSVRSLMLAGRFAPLPADTAASPSH